MGRFFDPLSYFNILMGFSIAYGQKQLVPFPYPSLHYQYYQGVKCSSLIISYNFRVVLTFLTVIFLYRDVPTSFSKPLLVTLLLSTAHKTAPGAYITVSILGLISNSLSNVSLSVSLLTLV